MRKLESWFRVGKQRMLQSHETLRHCNSSKTFISGPPYVAQALLAAVSVPVTLKSVTGWPFAGPCGTQLGALWEHYTSLAPRNGSAPRFGSWTHLTPTSAPRTQVCAPLARQTHFGRSLTRRRVGGNAHDCFSAGVAKPWPGQMPTSCPIPPALL
jgi:hypothetical protein